MPTKQVNEDQKRKDKRTKQNNANDQTNASNDSTEQAYKLPKRRIFPIWLRIVLVILLCVIAIILGAIIGFGVLGDGKPLDALKLDTWKHIVNIVKQK